MLSVEEKADQVFGVYERYGGGDYIGEAVSQLEHATQCAMLAEAAGAATEVVLGAFLHDIGHLVGQERGQQRMVTGDTVLGITNHEEIGRQFLAQLGVPSSVTDIVAGHVNAKRYLTWMDPKYYQALSPASKMTLEHQGGPMASEEAKNFEESATFRQILQMRQWDEGAKVANMAIEPLDKYKKMFIDLMNSL